MWSEKRSEGSNQWLGAYTALAEVKIGPPMLPRLTKASYVADVVGGEASCCPALLGNPGLVNTGAVIVGS